VDELGGSRRREREEREEGESVCAASGKVQSVTSHSFTLHSFTLSRKKMTSRLYFSSIIRLIYEKWPSFFFFWSYRPPYPPPPRTVESSNQRH
jgi:hypothetical protein